MVKLPHRMHRERRRLLFVEGAKPGVVLRPRLAQAYIPLDHLDDVGLLFHGLGKVGHERVCIQDNAGESVRGPGSLECQLLGSVDYGAIPSATQYNVR